MNCCLPALTNWHAAQALLRAEPVAVQVGLINDRVFLVNASVGLYPQLLEDREAYKARFGRCRLVAFGAGVVTLMSRYRQLRLRIELGPNAREITTPTLFVGNNRLQLEQVGVPQARSLDKGCIAAVMLRPIGALVSAQERRSFRAADRACGQAAGECRRRRARG